ncbi:MAG: hypothetical protein K2I95_01725 [Treponemataceae bacterium]|nr:hypothetical protein [Treponemataceae bacterium]
MTEKCCRFAEKFFTAILAIAILSGNVVFAQNSNSDVEESYKNMVAMIPVENEGMLAIQYDPFGQHEVSLVGAFSLLGPWSLELEVGLLDFLNDFAVSFGADVGNIRFRFSLIESISWGFGIGVPVYVHLIDLDVGINPNAQIDFTFFTNSDLPMTIYARPGARVSFLGDEARFTCPFGIGISISGDLLSNIVSGFGSIASSAM